MAYFLVHSRATALYFSRSLLYSEALSAFNGLSGLGYTSKVEIASSTLEIVIPGHHQSSGVQQPHPGLNEIYPVGLMLGW